MQKIYFLLLDLLLLALTTSCGPKDIGTSATEEEPIRTSVSSAEQMRYPMFGSDRTQKMLFLNNQMDSMVVRQNVISHSLQRDGQAISPEDPRYRLIPKQPSPFRQ